MNIHLQTPIKKSTGLIEKYSQDKLKRSLKISGLMPTDSEEITKEVEEALNPENLSTDDLFNKTKDIIFKRSHIAGFKYSLKNAILQLGPSGFIFEKYIAKALEAENYSATTDLILEGHCVRHEIDIRASKGNYVMLGECKFHNNQDTKNDLKTALYVKARMDDVRANPINKFDDFYLISNTSFSTDAIKYSTCSGLKLLGYNYPTEKTLYQIIEENKHYPITCIPWLKKNDINMLFEKNIILVHDLYQNLDLLKKLNYQIEDINHFKKTYEMHLSIA